MTKEIKLFIFYIFIVIFLIIFSSLFAVQRVPETSQFVVDRLVPLYPWNDVSQSYFSKNNGLNTILVHMRNMSLLNNKTVYFQLLNENGEELRKITINGANIGDRVNVRFQFEPIRDSKNNKYLILLSSPDTKIGDTPIEIGFSNADTYIEGSPSDKTQNGDFAFQTFYKPQDKLQIIFEVLNNIKRNYLSIDFFKSITLLILMVLFLTKKLNFRYN